MLSKSSSRFLRVGDAMSKSASTPIYRLAFQNGIPLLDERLLRRRAMVNAESGSVQPGSSGTLVDLSAS
jgi:hypothetical protein